MSLSNPLPRATRMSPPYATDGVNATYAVPFWFIDALDLQIILTPAGGAPTVLINGVGYTATGAGNPGGGTVTLDAIPAAGGTVQIVGHRVPSRTTSVVNSGVVVSAALEGALDAIEATLQELRRDSDQALTLQGANFNPKGVYSPATAYAPGEVVSFGGSTWRALVAVQNVTPGTDATKWFLLAQQGAPGAPGTPGADGSTFSKSGVAVINFGAYPGTDSAFIDVVDAAITAQSNVVAAVAALASADHSIAEHLIEDLELRVANIVAGVGFRIYAFTRSLWPLTAGTFNIAWIRR